MSGNRIFSNTASTSGDGWGGGLYLYGSGTTLINNMVADNQARAGGKGAGICVSGVDWYGPSDFYFHLFHSTIARNTGGDGSGIYVTDGGWGNYGTVAMTNTILVSQTVGITVTAGNTATLESTLWNGNTADWGGGGTINHSHDYTGTPAFVEPTVFDYHIRPSSEAINRGIDAGVTSDIDSQPRPWGSAPDLGADEYIVVTDRINLPLTLRRFQ